MMDKFQDILKEFDNYELLFRREFRFVPVIAEHALEGYKFIEEFSGAVFSNILYIYDGDFLYSLRKEGEIYEFSNKFKKSIKDNLDKVRNVIDESQGKKEKLESFNSLENKEQVPKFLKAHKEFTRLYIFLWLAGVSLDEEIDIIGKEYIDKFNEVRNSETFVTSLYEFFPKDNHKMLSKLFPEELVSYFQDEESYEFKPFFTILINNNKFSYTRDEKITKDFIKAIEEKRKIDEEELKDIEEIKGKTAYKGRVSGVVKVLLRKSDMDKVEEGDIIVSEMTTPEYVPVMKKSSAIVTDEGGVTCHAAIVSREMKKPCIIGTQNATQILKDGDRVEVNADEGIVKIIERR